MAGKTGTAGRFGPMFGARARDWADTWEGPQGWGTPAYEWTLDRAKVGPGTSVLDCGCGAGRFARLAADRGAQVAGIDASEALLEIARERTPQGDFRAGDLESLPWPDGSFDLACGFSSFQFAGDPVRALAEARRVSRGPVGVTIPVRPQDSGIVAVMGALAPLFPPEMQEAMKQPGPGMVALSAPGRLEEVLGAAGLAIREETEIDHSVAFADADAAVRAFLGAGPTVAAQRHAGEAAVAEAVRGALGPLTGPGGRVEVPSPYRVVIASP